MTALALLLAFLVGFYCGMTALAVFVSSARRERAARAAWGDHE